MPRPKSKEELLALSIQNFDKLNELIDSLSHSEQLSDFSTQTMNRNIRDVLGHLHHWHLMFLDWYSVGMSGEKPKIPAEGYNWRTLPALNRVIWEEYKEMELDKVREKFCRSHSRVLSIVDQHTHEELFEKKRYAWTGNNAISAYAIGVLSSHYDWGHKLIKKGKTIKKKGSLNSPFSIM